MSAFLTLIPFILIRYIFLNSINKEAFQRAAKFAPLVGNEKVAYWSYQISSILMLLYICFLRLTTDVYWLSIGVIIYMIGILLCLVSVINFSRPASSGINLNGLYRVSRNPMYVAYFIYFLGCVLLTKSFPLLVILFVFQISTHWIIRSEERWCVMNFGKEYINYMSKVRRYL